MNQDENIKFKCLKCGEILESLDEMENHFETEHPNETISYDLEETSTIEDSTEENPDEFGEVISEKELNYRKTAKDLLQHLEEWDKDTKTEIIQQSLNLTQKNRDGESRLKSMPEKRTTETIIPFEYYRILEKLEDESMKACPICHKEWSYIEKKMEENTEDLGMLDMNKKLESKIPLLRIIHVKSQHVPIWELIKDLFKIPKEMPNVAEPYTSNPEHLSELEELSKEELSLRIANSPELRKKLFRKWKRELEKRE